MIEIKKLTEEWQIYKQIRLDALTLEPDAFCSTLAREQGFPDEEWTRRCMSAYCAFEDGKPGGVLSAVEEGEDCHIYGVYVRNLARGKGIGEAMMEAALDDMQKKDVKRLMLSVKPGQRAAISLYKKIGFQIVKEACEIEMALDLTQQKQ